LERRPYGSNRDSMSRRIPDWDTEKLGIGSKGNERSIEDNEEAIRQEKAESSRTKGLRQCVAGKQEYLFESTLKEVG